MPVAGELVGRPQRSYLADLFDDGKSETVMTCMLFAFVEAGEHSAGIQRDRHAGIADGKLAGLQRYSDNAMGNVMVTGIAEQVVKQNVDQFRACPDDGR